jgi:chromosome segregation ATPase
MSANLTDRLLASQNLGFDAMLVLLQNATKLAEMMKSSAIPDDQEKLALKQQLESLQAKHEQLESDHKEVLADNKDLDEDNKHFSSIIETERADLEFFKSDYKTLNDRMLELEAERNSLLAKADELNQSLREARQAQQASSSQSSDSDLELEQLEQLKQFKEQAEADRSEIARLANLANRLHEENRKLLTSVNNRDAHVSALQKQTDELNAEIAELKRHLQTMVTTNSAMTHEKQGFLAEIFSLKQTIQQNEDSQREESHGTTALGTISKLQAEVSSLQAQLKDSEGLVTSLMDENDRLQSQFAGQQ